jgi:hypothetical protein
MGLAFTIIGLLLVITGIQNTYADFGSTVAGEFSGKNNFAYWIAAILLVGVLGYIPAMTKFSHWFMALILLSLFLSHKGFFQAFQSALAQGPTAPNVAGSNAAPAGSFDWRSLLPAPFGSLPSFSLPSKPSATAPTGGGGGF